MRALVANEADTQHPERVGRRGAGYSRTVHVVLSVAFDRWPWALPGSLSYIVDGCESMRMVRTCYLHSALGIELVGSGGFMGTTALCCLFRDRLLCDVRGLQRSARQTNAQKAFIIIRMSGKPITTSRKARKGLPRLNGKRRRQSPPVCINMLTPETSTSNRCPSLRALNHFYRRAFSSMSK